jgi:hypothetical protein
LTAHVIHRPIVEGSASTTSFRDGAAEVKIMSETSFGRAPLERRGPNSAQHLG